MSAEGSLDAARSSAGNILDGIFCSQRWLSARFDQLLADEYLLDGCKHFHESFMHEFLQPDSEVWDVGAGRIPSIGSQLKTELNLRVIGLDISADELAAAPKSVYDETVVADLLQFSGSGTADIVICHSVLEHVVDLGRALRSITSILKPGGMAVIFVPSRNAVFARLNVLIPHRLKTRILHLTRGGSFATFPAFYDRCTPRSIRQTAETCGLIVEKQRLYYTSEYFTFCFPLHSIWRLWVLLFRSVAGDEAAETMSMALRKRT